MISIYLCFAGWCSWPSLTSSSSLVLFLAFTAFLAFARVLPLFLVSFFTPLWFLMAILWFRFNMPVLLRELRKNPDQVCTGTKSYTGTPQICTRQVGGAVVNTAQWVSRYWVRSVPSRWLIFAQASLPQMNAALWEMEPWNLKGSESARPVLERYPKLRTFLFFFIFMRFRTNASTSGRVPSWGGKGGGVI